jgi:hypothetical protein
MMKVVDSDVVIIFTLLGRSATLFSQHFSRSAEAAA